jgi:hypothetical protein
MAAIMSNASSCAAPYPALAWPLAPHTGGSDADASFAIDVLDCKGK